MRLIGFQAATGLHKSLYNWAIGAGSGNAVADKLVLRAVRNELGMGRLRVAYVAGALPSSEIVSWAKALGISIQTIEA